MYNFVPISLLIIILYTEQIFGELIPIKPYEVATEENDLEHYHLAKVSPTGPYRVIIWDQFIQTDPKAQNQSCNMHSIFSAWEINPTADRKLHFNSRAFQEGIDELAKCFVHFYTVDTDELGQFLLQKNGRIAHEKSDFYEKVNINLVPLKNEGSSGTISLEPKMVPISDDGSSSLAQQIFIMTKSVPLDRICSPISAITNKHCAVEYFGTIREGQINARELMEHWLMKGDYKPLTDKANFFLVAIYRALFDEYKDAKLGPTDFVLLDILWTALLESLNSGDLIQRIGFADQRMHKLISHFCRIKHTMDVKFCEQWPMVLRNSVRFADPSLAKIAIRQWMGLKRVADHELDYQEMQKIVQYWLDRFVKRIGGGNLWSKQELDVFGEMGITLLIARKANQLTPQRMEFVDIGQLGKICKGIYRLWVNHPDDRLEITSWANMARIRNPSKAPKSLCDYDGKFELFDWQRDLDKIEPSPSHSKIGTFSKIVKGVQKWNPLGIEDINGKEEEKTTSKSLSSSSTSSRSSVDELIQFPPPSPHPEPVLLRSRNTRRIGSFDFDEPSQIRNRNPSASGLMSMFRRGG